MHSRAIAVLLVSIPLALVLGCESDARGTEADEIGVGASCDNDNPCEAPEEDGGDIELQCLDAFAGGYCGLEDCTENADCPDGSACVNHEGANYCFRTCLDKAECNENRGPDEESNCSSNVDFVDPDTSGKACVPPSSGD